MKIKRHHEKELPVYDRQNSLYDPQLVAEYAVDITRNCH